MKLGTKKAYCNYPVHDKHSHGADALRYACMAYRITKDAKIDTKKYYSAAPFRGIDSGWAL